MRAAMGERKMKARITRARVMTERMIREKMISIMAWGCTNQLALSLALRTNPD